MNVLFLHSGLMITGSVMYARALEHAWKTLHRAYWANDGFDPGERRGIVLDLQNKFLHREVANALQVVRFIRQKQIGILHAHSRRANVAAALASKLSGIPYVTTVHMRTRPRLGNRLVPAWGQRTIAICETIFDHLVRQNRVPEKRVVLIRNGIDVSVFRPDPQAARKSASDGRRITILGRLSGKRWNAVFFILSLIPELAERYPDLHFQFVGEIADDRRTEFYAALQRLNAGWRRPRVTAAGFAVDPRPWIAKSTLVLAAGRSLMEAMAMGIPVIAVGEQASCGLMTPDSFGPAQKTNFGDFPYPGQEQFDARATRLGMEAVLNKSMDITFITRWGRQKVTADHGLNRIARQVEGVYASLL